MEVASEIITHYNSDKGVNTPRKISGTLISDFQLVDRHEINPKFYTPFGPN